MIDETLILLSKTQDYTDRFNFLWGVLLSTWMAYMYKVYGPIISIFKKWLFGFKGQRRVSSLTGRQSSVREITNILSLHCAGFHTNWSMNRLIGLICVPSFIHKEPLSEIIWWDSRLIRCFWNSEPFCPLPAFMSCHMQPSCGFHTVLQTRSLPSES